MEEAKKTPQQEAEEQLKAAQEQAAAQQAAAQKMVEDQQKAMKKTMIISTIMGFVMSIGSRLISKFIS
jgi:multidrug efflux pump subunit AcrA (membrane-fusion protein)